MEMLISRIKSGFHEYFFPALAIMACCFALFLPKIGNAGAGGTTIERLNEPTAEGVNVKITASIITTKTWSLNFDASYLNPESGLYLINLNAQDGDSTFPENSTSSAEMIFNLKNLAIGENTVRVVVNYTGANEEEKTFAETVFTSEYKLDYQPAPVELPKITIQLQIEAFDKTLYNGDFEMTACLSTPSSTEATLNAWCAIEQLAQTNGWTINYSTSGEAKFLSAINNYNGADYNWWAFFHGLNFADEALNQYIIKSANEHILLSYGIFPLKIEGDANPLINTTTTVKAYAFGFDSTSWAPIWSLLPDTTIIFNGQENQSADGTFDFWTNTTTSYVISTKKTGYINSQNFLVNAALPNRNIHLQIAGPTNDLFNDNINVPACEESAGSGIYTINGKCAVQETKLDNSWSVWGTDAFINSIGEFKNNKDNNGIYWLWFSNLKDGGVALNKHELKALNTAENLLLTYGRYPLKIDTETTSTTLMLNTTTTISVKEFGFDGEWKPAWISAVSSTLVFGEGEEVNNDSGAYELFITTTTPYTVYGKKSGFLDSAPITIIGQEPTVEEPPIQNNPPPDNGGGGGGGGNDNDQPPTNPIVSDADIKTAVDKILAYLKSQQDATGKIIDGGTTDWAIMSLGANGEYTDEMLSFAKTYNFTDPSDMNLCAGYPRHIMALLAGGVSADDSVILNLKSKINSECYKDNLYGQNGINDDVFGVLALLAIGASPTEPIVQDAINTIKSDQTVDGAFTWAGYAGADITGAAINALKYAEIKGASIDPLILTRAKTYLKTTQLEDGGWGFDVSDPMTTSWVMMGINMLGEKQADWIKNDKNPWHVLVEKLSANGYYEAGWAPGTVEWFGTKHAVPALLGKSWPIFLPPRVTPPATQPTGGSAPEVIPTPTTTTFVASPTTTLSITPTTTLTFTTSTPTTTIHDADNLTQTTTTTLKHLSTSAPEHLSTPTETITTTTIDSELQITNYKLPVFAKATPGRQDTNNNLKSSILDLKSPTLSPAPPETPPEPPNPVSSAAKKLFAGSSVAAGGLGLYLAWRLLQTMV